MILELGLQKDKPYIVRLIGSVHVQLSIDIMLLFHVKRLISFRLLADVVEPRKLFW